MTYFPEFPDESGDRMKTKKIQVSKEYTLEFIGNSVVVFASGDGSGGLVSYEVIDTYGQPTRMAHKSPGEIAQAAIDLWRECQPLGDNEVEICGGRVRFQAAGVDTDLPMVVSGAREWWPFWKETGCPDPEKAQRWWLANYPMPTGKGLDLTTGKVRDLKPGESWDRVGKRIVRGSQTGGDAPCVSAYVKSGSTTHNVIGGVTWDMQLFGRGWCPHVGPLEVRLVTSGDTVVRNGDRIRVVQIGDFTPDRALELAEMLVKLAREVSAK